MSLFVAKLIIQLQMLFKITTHETLNIPEGSWDHLVSCSATQNPSIFFCLEIDFDAIQRKHQWVWPSLFVVFQPLSNKKKNF